MVITRLFILPKPCQKLNCLYHVQQEVQQAIGLKTCNMFLQINCTKLTEIRNERYLCMKSYRWQFITNSRFHYYPSAFSSCYLKYLIWLDRKIINIESVTKRNYLVTKAKIWDIWSKGGRVWLKLNLMFNIQGQFATNHVTSCLCNLSAYSSV